MTAGLLLFLEHPHPRSISRGKSFPSHTATSPSSVTQSEEWHYNRRWSRRGIWKRIFDTLASKSRDSLYLIDSINVKGQSRGQRRKKGEQNRRSALRQSRWPLDENLRHRRQQRSSAELHIAVTGGEVHDSQVAKC